MEVYPKNQGTNDALDSDANATGIAGPISLISGQVDLTWDAGLDPGNAAGGENGAAGEHVVEVTEEPIFEEALAAGEEIPLEKTGVPVGLLLMAVLIVLAGIVLPKRK